MIVILLALLIPIPVSAQGVPSEWVEAARAGRTERVKAMLEAGVKVNATDSNGYTALVYAAYMGRSETGRALLAAGADVNLKDFFGSCPLYPADASDD